jgi:hypothetical protein
MMKGLLKKDGKMGIAEESTTAKLLQDPDLMICQVCTGKGHDYRECGTKKRLDAWAREHDDVGNWGQWKYDTYYSGLPEGQKTPLVGKKRLSLVVSREGSPWGTKKRFK